MFAQRVLVALKVGGLLVLVAAVARLPGAGVDSAALTGVAGATADPTARNLAAAMVLVVFTYLGWQYIMAAVGEVRRPSRSLPIGLLAGMGTVIAIYLATLWCYYRALGSAGVAASDGVAASAASVAFGRLGGAFIAGLVVVSTLGSMSTSILAHSRIAFAAARDGLLFRGLDAIHPTFRTPSRAVLAHLIVC
jgi:APA family basic amino acid/polyamine antiporter